MPVKYGNNFCSCLFFCWILPQNSGILLEPRVPTSNSKLVVFHKFPTPKEPSRKRCGANAEAIDLSDELQGPIFRWGGVSEWFGLADHGGNTPWGLKVLGSLGGVLKHDLSDTQSWNLFLEAHLGRGNGVVSPPGVLSNLSMAKPWVLFGCLVYRAEVSTSFGACPSGRRNIF